jgi:protein arginine N-methyltransferase 1
MPGMYDLEGYGQMIADAGRMEAYDQALREAVRPDSVVVDIGTGTGIFAILAARYGARKVYAIEPSDAIEVAREIAGANGCADRIEFIQEMSTRVALPEPADLVISDMRGVLPLFELHLPSVVDARRRFLAPGGTLVPRQDVIRVAVVEAPESYRRCTVPWVENPFGLDMLAARRIVTNTWRKCRVKPDQLLTEPAPWATLNYLAVESPDVSGEVVFSAARAGTAHGLVLWFDTTLFGGVVFSNAPGQPELIYGSAFFPFSEPVELAAGDGVTVKLQAHLSGEDYLWSWDTGVYDGFGHRREKAGFRQSTFFGAPLSTARLQKMADSHVPSVGEEGNIDRFILELMDGRNGLGEIALRVSSRYPSRFPTGQKALSRVAELSLKYGV